MRRKIWEGRKTEPANEYSEMYTAQPKTPAGTGWFNTVFHVMKTFVSSNDSPHQILLYCDSFCEFGTKRIFFCKFTLSFEMFLQRMTGFWLSQKQCYCPVKKWEKCTFTSRSRMPVVFLSQCNTHLRPLYLLKKGNNKSYISSFIFKPKGWSVLLLVRRYASLALRTLSRLEWLSSNGISEMLLAV